MMNAGGMRMMRERPPSSYALKIMSFSLLSKSQTDRFESRVFQASGYNWTLNLYPNGNKKDEGTGHVSLYLAIADSSLVDPPHEVCAEFKLFVYNKKAHKYLTVQDGEIRRFDSVRRECGNPRLIPLGEFNDEKNGYLYDDQCVFGVEISVIKMFEKWEHLAIVEKPANGKFTWKLEKFSKLDKLYHTSDEFTVGATKWKLLIYPRGEQNSDRSSLSLFLIVSDDQTLETNQKVYANYMLRALDQRQSNHVERKAECWFSEPGKGWGYPSFMPIKDINDATKGFTVNDSVAFEVEFEAVSTTKYFPQI